MERTMQISMNRTRISFKVNFSQTLSYAHLREQTFVAYESEKKLLDSGVFRSTVQGEWLCPKPDSMVLVTSDGTEYCDYSVPEQSKITSLICWDRANWEDHKQHLQRKAAALMLAVHQFDQIVMTMVYYVDFTA